MVLLIVNLPIRLCVDCFAHLNLEPHKIPRERERHAGLGFSDQLLSLLPASTAPGIQTEPQELEAGPVREKDQIGLIFLIHD